LYIFKKIKQPIGTANDNFFCKETLLIWIVQYKNLLYKSCTNCDRKTQFHRSINVSSLFQLNYTKSMPLSILIKARSHNLPRLILSRWGSEAWKHQLQFTERSLATCNRYCYRQHYLQNNSKNVRTSGCD